MLVVNLVLKKILLVLAARNRDTRFEIKYMPDSLLEHFRHIFYENRVARVKSVHLSNLCLLE